MALVTPMRENGDIDWQALDRLIEWHIESGTHGIVPMGTTGESATLDTKEHLQVIKRTIDVVAKRIPVIAGTGSNSTAEAIHQTQEAYALGADACLLVTPYYNRPTQEGLYRHYEAIANSTEAAIILYNVPPRTGCDMQADTVARLAEFSNIVGIKDACGDASRVSAIKNALGESARDEFFILSGEDGQTLEMMDLGAVGTISVTANVLPKQMAEFCASYLAADYARARLIDAKLQPVHGALFVESSPTPTKWILSELGHIQAGIRLPLIRLSSQYHEKVRNAVVSAGAAE